MFETTEQLIFRVAIGFMVMGILYLLMAKILDLNPLQKVIAGSVFIGGAFMLVVTWLYTRPEVLKRLTEHIGWTLVGLVIVTMGVIRLLRK